MTNLLTCVFIVRYKFHKTSIIDSNKTDIFTQNRHFHAKNINVYNDVPLSEFLTIDSFK